MRAYSAFFLLLCAVSPVLAGSGEDLARAKQDFEQVKRIVTDEINALEQRRREAIWTQYYRALEQLQRMEVHHQMMSKHNQNRSEQFARARTEFTRAVNALHDLVP